MGALIGDVTLDSVTGSMKWFVISMGDSSKMGLVIFREGMRALVRAESNVFAWELISVVSDDTVRVGESECSIESVVTS